MSEKRDKMLAEWFWTDRWQGSTGFELPIGPRGLYREMLTQAWRKGGSLPNDPETIRRICGVTEEEWNACWPRVSAFWRVDGDRIVNDTQLAVYKEAQAAREGAKKRAKDASDKAAELRKGLRDGIPDGIRDGHRDGPPTRTTEKESAKESPPSPSLIGTTSQEKQPNVRPSVEAARVDLRAALTVARQRHPGKSDQELLAMHPAPRTGAVIDLERCDREDWMRTVAARLRTPVKAAKARKGDPWGGEPDDAQAMLELRASNWLIGSTTPRTLAELRATADEAPEDIRGAVTMILFARNPHLRKPAETRGPEVAA